MIWTVGALAVQKKGLEGIATEQNFEEKEIG